MAVDVQALIARVMADPKVQTSMRVYEDEPIVRRTDRETPSGGEGRPRPVPASSPIAVPDTAPARQHVLMTGRQLLEERERDRLPEAYAGVRALEHDPACRAWSDARLFYEQGRLLAEVEDDAPYGGAFERYFPTYRMMNNRQLRGYITWRTRVRAGGVEPAPTSFAFVYVYELLCGFGCTDPDDGFLRLSLFWSVYRILMPDLDHYLRRWLADYAVCFGVSPHYVRAHPALSENLAREEALWVLTNPQGRDADELFAAVTTLSGYRIDKSRFYRDYPEDVKCVVLAVLASLEAYCAKNRQRGLYEGLFGAVEVLPYEMFTAAVFYQPQRHPDTVYELNPMRRYRCQGGRWSCERPYGGRGGSKRLGEIVKLVDARMRARSGYAHPLKDEGGPKYLLAIVDKEIDAWQAEKEARAARQITIDRSKLRGIRSAAAATCEDLLVDEERGEAVETADVRLAQKGAGPVEDNMREGTPHAGSSLATSTPVPDVEQHAASTSGIPSGAEPGPAGLTGAEALLLRRILSGEPYADALAEVPVSLDMLVDAVNEKLFDLLGDTALEFDGAAVTLVEDYRDDVEGILQA